MGSLYLVQKRIIMNMKQNAHTGTHMLRHTRAQLFRMAPSCFGRMLGFARLSQAPLDRA